MPNDLEAPYPGYDFAVPLTLSHDEALVLFEMLSRWFESDDSEAKVPFEHPSEARALDRILGACETVLVEPFTKNYLELLESARVRVSSAEQND